MVEKFAKQKITPITLSGESVKSFQQGLEVAEKHDEKIATLLQAAMNRQFIIAEREGIIIVSSDDLSFKYSNGEVLRRPKAPGSFRIDRNENCFVAVSGRTNAYYELDWHERMFIGKRAVKAIGEGLLLALDNRNGSWRLEAYSKLPNWGVKVALTEQQAVAQEVSTEQFKVLLRNPENVLVRAARNTKTGEVWLQSD